MVVLGAIAAGSAFAENEWVEGTSAWYTGASPGTKLPESERKVLKASAATPILLESMLSSKPLKLEAGGLECQECTIRSMGSHALTVTKFKLTSVKLIEPEASFCSVETPIVFKVLQGPVGMRPEVKPVGPATTLLFAPQAGETFLTFNITGGMSCRVAGLYRLVGTLYGEALNPTGAFAATQQLRFSKAIQQSAGTVSSLKQGTNAAWFTGTIDLSLAPEVEYAPKEK